MGLPQDEDSLAVADHEACDLGHLLFPFGSFWISLRREKAPAKAGCHSSMGAHV